MKKSFTFQVLAMTVVMAFLALPLTLKGQGSKTNFSGSWVLNASKSNMGQQTGGGGRMGGGDFTAKQEGNNLAVTRTFNRNGETSTIESKYTLDGKETTNTMGGRGSSKSTATWSADGKSLTIKTTSEFNGNSMTRTEVWTLTSPTSLTITRTSPGRDGGAPRTTTMVYDKK
jgi:hypothetical protein